MKILVVRNDKIGDFMLVWPALAMIKKALPNAQLIALVPAYTRELAEICPWIDGVIVDCGEQASTDDKQKLLAEIKGAHFDASIHYFSTFHTAWLTYRAKIPFRLAPATKWFQFFYTHRLMQRRSQSTRAEFEYNTDLSRYFLSTQHLACETIHPPYLILPEDIIEAQRKKLSNRLQIDLEKPWLFVHSGDGGSANNLSIEQYAELIAALNPACEIILTAGPSEEIAAMLLKGKLEAQAISCVVYAKNDGLRDFVYSIGCADAFIAGSTGPLHIAGALNIPTLGFYPAKRSATPLRWQTLNTHENRRTVSPPPANTKEAQCDMTRINPVQVAEDLGPWLIERLSAAKDRRI
jgi:ADP-heptose:LPS heptosyltransferase